MTDRRHDKGDTEFEEKTNRYWNFSSAYMSTVSDFLCLLVRPGCVNVFCLFTNEENEEVLVGVDKLDLGLLGFLEITKLVVQPGACH